MEDVRRIEFQRIHRIGKKCSRYTRPVIARFLRYQDRELVFNAAREMRDSLEVKVLAESAEGSKLCTCVKTLCTFLLPSSAK